MSRGTAHTIPNGSVASSFDHADEFEKGIKKRVYILPAIAKTCQHNVHSSMTHTPDQQVMKLARRQGILRPRDLADRNLPRRLLTRLVDEGRLARRGRGLYVPADAELPAQQSLAEAAKRVPHGVVCLLSALQYHELTTQSPFEVWLAIDRKARRPRIDYPPVRIVRFSGEALTAAVKTELIGGVAVPVYEPAKTVADCFKYRNKIGIDVAVEALRDGLRSGQVRVNDLWRYAGICRVTNVIRPYLEAMQ